MRRRDFVILLGAGAAWPPAVHAQQQTMPLIGFLSPASPVEYAQLVAAFRRGLDETGYTEGQHVSRFEIEKLPPALSRSSCPIGDLPAEIFRSLWSIPARRTALPPVDAATSEN